MALPKHKNEGSGMSNIDTRVALLEQCVQSINSNLIEIKTDLKEMRKEFRGEIGGVKSELKTLNDKIDTKHIELLNRIDGNNKWLLSIYVSSSLAFLAILVNIGLRFYFR